MKRKLLATLALASVVCLFEATNAPAAVHYVDVNGTNATPPYTNWANAAKNIQDAVNVSAARDEIVVTNGVYPGSVTVTNSLALRSVNGPQFTVINGGGTNRCVSLNDGASLSGFTLTNGYATSGGGAYCSSANAFLTNCVIAGNEARFGGGAWGGTLYDCTLSGNSAGNSTPATNFGSIHQFRGGGAYGSTLYNCTLQGNSSVIGGGAYNCTLNNCMFIGNQAWGRWVWVQPFPSPPPHWEYWPGGGGGARGSTLHNCTLTGNSSNGSYGSGGGAGGGTLYNCIVYFNTASEGTNYDASSTLNFCCSTPLPATGVGSITNEPLFLDRTNGNLRLQSNSPCINAGNNAYAPGPSDLDDNPRVVSGTVDIGAYECQGTGSVLSYAWLQQHGLPTDGTADLTDSDLDGADNWQEWMADTDPTNMASSLRLTIISNTPPVAVTFSSSAARLYTLLCSTNLTPSSVWTPVPGQSDMPGSGDVLTLTDANPPATAFYRVSVRFP